MKVAKIRLFIISFLVLSIRSLRWWVALRCWDVSPSGSDNYIIIRSNWPQLVGSSLPKASMTFRWCKKNLNLWITSHYFFISFCRLLWEGGSILRYFFNLNSGKSLFQWGVRWIIATNKACGFLTYSLNYHHIVQLLVTLPFSFLKSA